VHGTGVAGTGNASFKHADLQSVANSVMLHGQERGGYTSSSVEASASTTLKRKPCFELGPVLAKRIKISSYDRSSRAVVLASRGLITPRTVLELAWNWPCTGLELAWQGLVWRGIGLELASKGPDRPGTGLELAR
jgi:hypothetical protein